MHNYGLIKLEICSEKDDFSKNVNFASSYTQKIKPLQDNN